MFNGSHHVKEGWPGQIRFKMAGTFKTTTCFLRYVAAYKGHNAPAKHIYMVCSGRTQPHDTCKCRRVLLRPHMLCKTQEPDT